MSKKIKLYWYQHREGHGNFGDELNPYIIERLTGSEIQWTSAYNGSRWNSLRTLAYLILKEHYNFKKIRKSSAWQKFFNQPVIFSIGSIIHNCDTNVKVWGSGIISSNKFIPEAQFLAVRGKYTAKRLVNLGYKAPKSLGDPALLLPLVFNGNNTKKFKIGIIPHYIHYEELKKLNCSEVKVINLLDSIEKIIDDIGLCEVTISTSLHGVIVSHCYKVPSLWVDFEIDIKLTGDNIKFADYFSSVDLKEYFPFKIDKNYFDLKTIENLFSANTELTLPKKEKIVQIQRSLLSCAPFEILPKYKTS
jgi:pyruvyltransferase